MKAIVAAMVTSGRNVESSQVLTALISTIGMQSTAQEELMTDLTVDQLMGLKYVIICASFFLFKPNGAPRGVMKSLSSSMTWKGIETVLQPILASLVRR